MHIRELQKHAAGWPELSRPNSKAFLTIRGIAFWAVKAMAQRPSTTRLLSSCLSFAAYDYDREVLTLTFTSGHRYSYFGVSPTAYAALLAAPSKGRFFLSSIRSQVPVLKNLAPLPAIARHWCVKTLRGQLWPLNYFSALGAYYFQSKRGGLVNCRIEADQPRLPRQVP